MTKIRLVLMLVLSNVIREPPKYDKSIVTCDVSLPNVIMELSNVRKKEKEKKKNHRM